MSNQVEIVYPATPERHLHMLSTGDCFIHADDPKIVWIRTGLPAQVHGFVNCVSLQTGQVTSWHKSARITPVRIEVRAHVIQIQPAAPFDVVAPSS